jgi:shikimate dehydrogenase
MAVMDIVYNPLETRLLQTAADRGCVVVQGLGMFIHQGAEQFELWTGLEAPVALMSRVVEEALTHEGD